MPPGRPFAASADAPLSTTVDKAHVVDDRRQLVVDVVRQGDQAVGCDARDRIWRDLQGHTPGLPRVPRGSAISCGGVRPTPSALARFAFSTRLAEIIRVISSPNPTSGGSGSCLGVVWRPVTASCRLRACPYPVPNRPMRRANAHVATASAHTRCNLRVCGVTTSAATDRPPPSAPGAANGGGPRVRSP